MLFIEKTGSLFVLWSSNTTTSGLAASVAILLDSGNFVVRDEMNSSMTIWQSFDYPNDAVLPGARIRIAGYNPVYDDEFVMLRICDPPFCCTLYTYGTGRGMFSIEVDYQADFFRKDYRAYELEHPQYLWSNGKYNFEGKFPNWMFTYKGDNSYAHLNVPKSHDSIEFMKLELGGLSLLRWSGSVATGAWQTLWSIPSSCNDSSYICGAFGSCTQAGKCRCIEGFEPRFSDEWELGRSTSGCSGIHQLNCENGTTTDSFVLLENLIEVLGYAPYKPATSIEDCKLACLSNCNCTAYFYDHECMIWPEKLHGLKFVAYPPYISIYVRVGSAEKKRMRTKDILALSIGLVAIIVVGSLIFWTYKRLSSRKRKVEGFLVVYSYAQLKKATQNFSEELGAGGFGSVYKGMMAGSTFVAVKNLKDLGYGDKQFRTEVQTIGLIQQTNLVHLLGFCAEGTRRLLVYEYMANGSLDTHLFSGNSCTLSWNLRYQIALGIAKGLAYLHEECNHRIIHCDIKPENILLDDEFRPKIADFGMAKLLRREYNAALTTFRGTIGYLAPEWLSGLAVTCKADVYSFGIVLFELISGRRTTKRMRFGNHSYFPSYAASQVNEGEVLCLLDSRLHGNADVKELDVLCRVACWCIQDNEGHRPSMGEVVRVLEGAVGIEIPPIPASFEYLMDYDDSGVYSAEGSGFKP